MHRKLALVRGGVGTDPPVKRFGGVGSLRAPGTFVVCPSFLGPSWNRRRLEAKPSHSRPGARRPQARHRSDSRRASADVRRRQSHESSTLAITSETSRRCARRGAAVEHPRTPSRSRDTRNVPNACPTDGVSRRGFGPAPPLRARTYEREIAIFELTESKPILSLILEHWRSDARPRATLSPTIAIQGSASVLGVHARSSGSPKDYVEPTYANA